jgi:hypothetical protein
VPDTPLVAIHQPNFFPWLGYFDKIARADVFVLLDNVQFSKTGGNWSNRVRLIVNGEAAWVTVPVIRNYHGVREIREMRIDESSGWRRKFLQNVRTNYARAAAFDAVFPFVERLVHTETDLLSEFNVTVIRAICGELQLPLAKLVLGSSLQAEGRATELLISMVRSVGGTAYLCGGGAGGYQDDQAFSAAGLRLVYQEFAHPSYEQRLPAFVPGLSIVDALMHCGFDGVRALLGTPGNQRH